MIASVDQDQAEQALQAWASVERDELVRAAYEAGVSKNRIHTITGIARTTIDRILEPSMQQLQQSRLTEFLMGFTRDWPRQGPHDFYIHPAMASSYSPEDIAQALLADVKFKALKLGTVLNTPDGKLLAAAIEAITPAPYRHDVALLVEALKLAAKGQQEEARAALIRGAVIAVGVSAAVAALGRASN